MRGIILLSRTLTSAESGFVYRLLEISTEGIKLHPITFMKSDEGLSLPGGSIFMNPTALNSTGTDPDSMKTLVHEVFHQYQYKNQTDLPFPKLIIEAVYNVKKTGTKYYKSTYAKGDFRVFSTDLSKINKLSELPKEGQA